MIGASDDDDTIDVWNGGKTISNKLRKKKTHISFYWVFDTWVVCNLYSMFEQS